MANRTALRVSLIALLLVGCTPDTNMPLQEQQSQNATYAPVQDSNRIQVMRIGVFRDTLAYYDKRGVYLIVDRKTGHEYIGISGVGITEVGSHNCGKNCTTEDER